MKEWEAQFQCRYLQEGRRLWAPLFLWIFHRVPWLGSKRKQILELQFDEFPTPSSFLCWKIRFRNQVAACSDFPSEAMLWIKEVEMVDSMEELKSSRSVAGKNFPNFEMLDAKIASALNKIIQNSHFKKKVSLVEQKAPKEDRFLRGRQIADATITFESLVLMIPFLIALIYSLSLFVTIMYRNSTQDRDEVLLCQRFHPMMSWESLYNLRIRESDQLKTVLELYDMEIHQKISTHNYQS